MTTSKTESAVFRQVIPTAGEADARGIPGIRKSLNRCCCLGLEVLDGGGGFDHAARFERIGASGGGGQGEECSRGAANAGLGHGAGGLRPDAGGEHMRDEHMRDGPTAAARLGSSRQRRRSGGAARPHGAGRQAEADGGAEDGAGDACRGRPGSGSARRGAVAARRSARRTEAPLRG